MIPKSIVRALNGQPVIVFGDGSQTRDFTYVEDTARVLVAAAESDIMIGQTLNIGSNFEISIKDLAYKIIEKVANTETEVVFTPQRPGDVLRLYADPRKFIDLCAWQPQVSFDEGLTKTIDFFRNHPLGIKSLMESESGRNWEEV
jgi:UDP-glucose 4-epimerase